MIKNNSVLFFALLVTIFSSYYYRKECVYFLLFYQSALADIVLLQLVCWMTVWRQFQPIFSHLKATTAQAQTFQPNFCFEKTQTKMLNGLSAIVKLVELNFLLFILSNYDQSFKNEQTLKLFLQETTFAKNFASFRISDFNKSDSNPLFLTKQSKGIIAPVRRLRQW